MDPFKDENSEKLDFKTEIDNEPDSKKDNTEIFSFPSFKCGEVFVSNSASGQFELKCILCSRQFQKIKQFAKHILKDHLNSDLEHSIDDLVKDIEFATTSSIDNDSNDDEIPVPEEQLTCEVNLSFLHNNEFEDENNGDTNADDDDDDNNNENNKIIESQGNIENEEDNLNSENSEEDESKSINSENSENSSSASSNDSIVNETLLPKVSGKPKNTFKKFNCKYCKAKYIVQSNLQRHLNRKHTVKIERERRIKSPTNKLPIEKINCNVCGKETTKYKLMQHLRSHDDTRYTNKCNECGKLFISERSLDLHNRNLHLKERPYACKFDKCNRAFVTEHGLIAHQKIHTNDRPFMCPICHKGFFRKTKLDYHFETHHINRQVFTCDECGKQFMNTKTLERHKICSHLDNNSDSKTSIKHSTDNDENNIKLPTDDLSDSVNYDDQNEVDNSNQIQSSTTIQQTITNKRGTYECIYCELKFIYKANLKEHINRKHDSQIDQTKLLAEKAEIDKRNASKPQSTAICDICGKETLKTRMRQHLRSHDNTRYTHKCETCGKLFISEKSMNIHIRNLHLKDRPYPCKFDNCNKKFATENALNAHYQIHTCERQFKCNICEKGFFTQAKHDYHVKTYHINGRIYKCDECDKRFYENGSLQAHKICHSNEKPFACDECPARFPRERSLHIHKQSHSGIKEYFCKMCNKDYALYNGIYTHMKTHGISYSAAMEKGLAGQRSST